MHKLNLPAPHLPPPQYRALDDHLRPSGTSSDLVSVVPGQSSLSDYPKHSADPATFTDLEPGLPETEPPTFSLYRAAYTTDSLGNITSHDAHLNSDGEALCRFILLHTTAPPELFLKLTGTHEEVKRETFTEYVDGRPIYKTRERQDTITDFSFTVPLRSEPISEAPVRLVHVVNDGEVVHRGQRRRERVDWTGGKDVQLLNRTPDSSRWPSPLLRSQAVRGSWKERRAADRVAKEVKRHGLPPFIPPWLFPERTFSTAPPRPPPELVGPDWESSCARVLRSFVYEGHYLHTPHPLDQAVMEQELRNWCDAYCQSTKCLKQFTVEKRSFGWDLDYLERELESIIRAIPRLQSTHIDIDFHSTSSRITIRPVNKLSKLFSLGFFPKFLLTITLIYPLLWLVRYLIVGADFSIVRVGYPLVYWVRGREDGVVLKGKSEREWLRANVELIKRACEAGLVGSL
ncbi:hypothetical protein CROQUDRAFT_656509 [Cronartium quercuum f. sp. fusiforme G11]|uniref:Uncharacterized protein n=1 Tax=Cronartium quercuum f. sp. fusiforme G11 TaxID=708437 RepID=A0A9P6TC82_9BASI|nr:hypothetical protein CROQUDRAFT_656509 [Cronartium quercuum f. sp. fusiforme G11]